MKIYLFGLLTGLILAGLILVGLPFLQPTLVGRLATSNEPSGSAATANNISQSVPASQRFPLTLAISDNGGQSSVEPATDLTSLSVTFSQTVIKPTSFTNPTLKIGQNHQEILNLTQPTIELFSLHGSGALTDLATTDLAAGTYQTLELTIGSLRGRTSGGQVVEIPVTTQNSHLKILLNQTWSPTTSIQVVIDFDSLASVSQTAQSYSFVPVIRQVFVNDELVTSSP
ncbi:MAG: DUF4382 domain-containing protein [Patescibacteria group bacterium]